MWLDTSIQCRRQDFMSLFHEETIQIQLTILFPTEFPFGRSPDLTGSPGPSPNNTLMHSSLNTVIHLQVKLWKHIVFVCRLFFDITKTGLIDNITNDETLDSLILGDGFSSGSTSNALNMSASVLITSVITPFDSHFEILFGDFVGLDKQWAVICERKGCIDKRRTMSKINGVQLKSSLLELQTKFICLRHQSCTSRSAQGITERARGR